MQLNPTPCLVITESTVVRCTSTTEPLAIPLHVIGHKASNADSYCMLGCPRELFRTGKMNDVSGDCAKCTKCSQQLPGVLVHSCYSQTVTAAEQSLNAGIDYQAFAGCLCARRMGRITLIEAELLTSSKRLWKGEAETQRSLVTAGLSDPGTPRSAEEFLLLSAPVAPQHPTGLRRSQGERRGGGGAGERGLCRRLFMRKLTDGR